MPQGFEICFHAGAATLAMLEAPEPLKAEGWNEPRTSGWSATWFVPADRRFRIGDLAVSTEDEDGRSVTVGRLVTAAKPWLGSWQRWTRAPFGAGPDGSALEFRVTGRRTTWTRTNDKAMSLAITRGTIAAGRRRRAIGDVTLSLEGGTPGTLIAAALGIHRNVAPLVLQPDSLAERGFRLATRRDPRPRRARNLRLAPDLDTEGGCKAILAAGLAQVLRNVACASLARDSEGVHQLRVGIRRLRTAMAVLRPLLPGSQRRAFADDLGWLGEQTGAAREWDVLIDTVLASPAQGGGLEAARATAARRRRAAYARARRALAAPRTTELALGLMASIEEPWRDAVKSKKRARLAAPLADHIGAILGAADRRLRRLGEDTERDAVDRLHQCRIAAKRAATPPSSSRVSRRARQPKRTSGCWSASRRTSAQATTRPGYVTCWCPWGCHGTGM